MCNFLHPLDCKVRGPLTGGCSMGDGGLIGLPDEPRERFWYTAATNLHIAIAALPADAVLSMGTAGELLLDDKPMGHWKARGSPFELTFNGTAYVVYGKEDAYDSHSDACAGVQLSGVMIPKKRRASRLTWSLNYMDRAGDSDIDIEISKPNGEDVEIDEEEAVQDAFYANMICMYQFPYQE